MREYWLVDPEEPTVAVHELAEGGYRLVKSFGPGETVVSTIFDLKIPLDPIFEI